MRPEPPIGPEREGPAMSKPAVVSVPVVNAEADAPLVSDNAATAPGYLGLDVGQRQVSACLLLADGREAVRRWSVPNHDHDDHAGARQRTSWSARGGERGVAGSGSQPRLVVSSSRPESRRPAQRRG